MKIDAQWFQKNLVHLDAAELYALTRSAADLKVAGGNQNGVWDESGGLKLGGPPLAQGVEARARVGISKEDEAKFVASILEKKLAEWGDNVPLTNLAATDIPHFERFVARKIIELARYGRDPSEVSELIVPASGKVKGVTQEIDSSNVFVQHVRPPKGVERNGHVAVVAPGFQETGRHYLDVVDDLSRRGYEVLVMDQLWAGHTAGGQPGGMKDMLQAAIAVAAVTAKAEEIRKNDPELAAKNGKVGIFAISMSGASALLAQNLNDHGRLDLDGPKMPDGVRVAAIAPFGKAKPNVANTLLKGVGHVPIIKDIPLTSVGLPILTDAADAKKADAQEVMLEGITARASALVHAETGAAMYRRMISQNLLPKGEVMLVHARGDRVADFKQSVWLDRELGRGSELVSLPGKNHVFQQSAAERGTVIAAFDRLMGGDLKPTLGWSKKLDKPADDPAAWIKATASRIKKAVDQKLGLDSHGKIGWLSDAPPPHVDETAKFKELHAMARAGNSPLPSDAGEYTYLFVPGLFTEHYPGYLGDNLARMKERGLDAKTVPIDTDAGVQANAKVVKKAIEEAAKSGKKVVLVGHSKGGVDLTAALSLYPELQQHVRAVVAMQTPFGGTPIATDIQGCKELRPLVARLVEGLFNGDARALADLSYEARQSFLEKHAYPTDIPTVCLASASSDPISLTAAASAYVRHRYDEPCDGLVPQKDALIPGSTAVKLDDLDHAGPAMRGPSGLCKYRPADVTEALIAMALAK